MLKRGHKTTRLHKCFGGEHYKKISHRFDDQQLNKLKSVLFSWKEKNNGVRNFFLPWHRVECGSWWFVHDYPLGGSHRILKKKKRNTHLTYERSWICLTHRTPTFNMYLLPLTLFAAAARTSASQSFRRFWKAGTRSFLVISGPTAFWSYREKSELWSRIQTYNPDSDENSLNINGMIAKWLKFNIPNLFSLSEHTLLILLCHM